MRLKRQTWHRWQNHDPHHLRATSAAAVAPVFETLDWLEQHLASRRFLVGDGPTEADWRLFTTLVRFDAVYYGHFKCDLRRVIDYPNVWSYTRELYQWPGIAATVDLSHIKRHYYMSHRHINPSGMSDISTRETDLAA